MTTHIKDDFGNDWYFEGPSTVEVGARMSHVITRAQKKALAVLLARHAAHPHHGCFFAGFLGTHTAASLRKLEPSGFVSINRMAENCFQYSITESGKDFLAGRLVP